MVVIITVVLVGIVAALFAAARLSRPPSLGVHQGRLLPCPDSPNCVSSQSKDERHAVEPIRFDSNGRGVIIRLLEIIESMPRTKIVEKSDTYIRGEFRTPIFRFTDDVEFLIDEENRVIHIRSASRVGYSDLGANRKRAGRIREKFAETDDG
jgi:uncharacterized protein (DUF1499 family)